MLFDDQIDSPTLPQPAPTSSLLTPPSSGLGLASPAPAMPAAPAGDFGDLSGVGKMGLALQAFGAGMAGKEPLMNQIVKEKRQEQILKLQTFHAHTQALEDSVKMVKGLKGDAKTSFIEQQAVNLEKVNPQLGTAFRTLAQKPDMSDAIAKYAEDIPQIKMAYELGGEDAVYKLMQSEKFHEYVQKRADVKELPMVTQKVRSMIAFLPQFDPEMHKRFMKDGVIDRAELDELNATVAKHPEFGRLALSPEQQTALNRNDEVALAGLPVLTGKKTQDIQEARAKEAITHPDGRKPEQFTEENNGVKTTYEMKDGKKVAVARTPQWKPGEDPASAIRAAAQSNKDRDTELRLADDYARDTKGFKETKAKFSAATQYYAQVAEGKKAPTPADDRALVFTYAKMLDPGDKVAVQDVKDIGKLAGVPQRVIQGVQNIVQGNLLPPDVRRDMYATIRKEFSQHNRNQSQLENEYRQRGDRYKLDSRNIVIPHSMSLD